MKESNLHNVHLHNVHNTESLIAFFTTKIFAFSRILPYINDIANKEIIIL